MLFADIYFAFHILALLIGMYLVLNATARRFRQGAWCLAEGKDPGINYRIFLLDLQVSHLSIARESCLLLSLYTDSSSAHHHRNLFNIFNINSQQSIRWENRTTTLLARP